MAVKTVLLGSSNAFSEGSHLWCIPSIESSSWGQKLDWLLNFQISRANAWTKPQLTKEQRDQLVVYGVQFQELALPEPRPLLLSAIRHLPAQWVLCQQSVELDPWLQGLQKVWLDLGQPSLRIFLPKGTATDTPSALMKSWKGNESLEVTFVAEP